MIELSDHILHRQDIVNFTWHWAVKRVQSFHCWHKPASLHRPLEQKSPTDISGPSVYNLLRHLRLAGPQLRPSFLSIKTPGKNLSGLKLPVCNCIMMASLSPQLWFCLLGDLMGWSYSCFSTLTCSVFSVSVIQGAGSFHEYLRTESVTTNHKSSFYCKGAAFCNFPPIWCPGKK